MTLPFTPRQVSVPLIALIAITTAPARADDLQRQLVAGAASVRPDAYAFHQTLAGQRDSGATEVIVDQFDPRRPDGERWTRLSINGHAPTPKEVERARKGHAGPVPSYHELARWIGAPATRSEPEAGHVLLRFDRLPAGVLMIGSHDASPDTRADALVDTSGPVPVVERVRFTLAHGFRVMLVATLSGMTADARYRRGPDGAMVPASVSSVLTGSMMGRSGTIRSTITYSDVQRVR